MTKKTVEPNLKKGIKTKLLGFCFMALGMMNFLLSVRSGSPISDHHFLFLSAGLLFFIIGTVRSGSPTK